jgi:hypothetical protein
MAGGIERVRRPMFKDALALFTATTPLPRLTPRRKRPRSKDAPREKPRHSPPLVGSVRTFRLR